MRILTLGIDLGKNVCSVTGLDSIGGVVMTRRIRRHRLLSFLSELKPCVVAMEACGGAHHVARFCQSVGHEPRLMSPLYVRPYQPATLPKYAVTPVEWHGPTSIQPSSNYSSKYQGQNFGWLFWGT